jgi:hypothetical protein
MNMTRIFRAPVNQYRPIDFRPLYLGQYVLLRGGNPYDLEEHVEAWKEISAQEGYRPAGKTLALVYPPWALTMFLVFAPLSFSAAYIVWYLSLPLLTLALIYCCLRYFSTHWSWVAYWEAVLLVFAFKGTIQSMTVAQPLFLCLGFGFASLMYYKKRKEIVSGVLLGLAAFKITLALPFAVYFFLKGRTKVILTAMVTGLCLYSVSASIAGTYLGLVTSWIRHLTVHFPYAYNQSRPSYPTTYGMVTKTEVGVLMEYLIHGINESLSLIYLGLLGLLMVWWLIYFRPKRPTNLLLFLSLALLGLLTTHHFYYDCLILIPLYVLATKVTSADRRLLFLLTGAFWIPVNGILNRIPPPPPLDVLYFTTPLTLVALAGFLFWKVALDEPYLVQSPKTTNQEESGDE